MVLGPNAGRTQYTKASRVVWIPQAGKTTVSSFAERSVRITPMIRII